MVGAGLVELMVDEAPTIFFHIMQITLICLIKINLIILILQIIEGVITTNVVIFNILMDRTMAGKTATREPTPRIKGLDSEIAVGLSMKVITLIKLILIYFCFLINSISCQMDY